MAARIPLLVSMAALSACQGSEQPDQNIIIDNNVPADADIEALPEDESSATSTEELVNGESGSVADDQGNDATTQ